VQARFGKLVIEARVRSLSYKLGFLDLASPIPYLDSLHKRSRNLSCRLDLNNKMLQNFQHITSSFTLRFFSYKLEALSWRLAQPPSRLSLSTSPKPHQSSPSHFLLWWILLYPVLLHHEELLPGIMFDAKGLNVLFFHWNVRYKLKHLGAPPSILMCWWNFCPCITSLPNTSVSSAREEQMCR